MKANSTSRCNTCISQLSNVIKTATGKTVVVFFMALLSFQSLKANDIYAISGGNLIAFKAANPGTITFSVPLTGVVSGQVIEGLDFRPATGQLFAIGYVAASGLTQVYSIDYKTGVATAIGAPVTLAANMVRVGMDFNPTVDRIRVTAFGGQNYRLNPITGGIAATDGNLNYASGDVHAGVNPRIEAVAYTNSYFGGTPALVTATTLYYYDYGFDDLVNSTNPNGGVLNTVGNSSIVSLSGNGLDLDIVTNPATGVQCGYLTANTSGSTQTLYSVNLATGKASSKGVIGANISEMAIFLALPTPELVYAISSTGNLISFNSNAPSTVLTTDAVSGVTAGQVIEGLDFRAATGQLYALGYAAATGQTQVYTVDTVTGTATSVGAAITLAANMTNVTMDFNPMADRIRVTSAEGNNYRLVPTTGALAFTDGNLTYAPGDIRAANKPAIAAVAYTNSFSGPVAATTIYYYDLALNSLVLSTNPNGGVLNTVGVSGLMPANATGVDMDISSNPGIVPNTAFISVSTSGTTSVLYSLNLTNGNARMLDTIGSGGTITDFAVYIAPPTPSRTVYALSGGSLIKFNTTTPGTVQTVGTLSGIIAGQTVEGLDFRPASLDLYALGYNATDGSARIYVIDTTSAAATPVGTANITLATGMSRLGVDFNPTVDRIRVTSATGQNYRLNPITGALQIQDGTLTYAPGDASVVAMPSINAAGYTNSMNAAMTTRLYYYDFMLDALATTSLPNDGILNTVGRSGIITSTGNGLDMDIVRTPSNNTNTGFLSATVSGTTSNFYSINLVTGEARLIGAIGGAGITEMAIRLAGLDGSRVAPLLITLNGKKEGKNSQLSWTTETEVNNSHFILERSADGARFTAISGSINSAATDGNSNTALNYTYKDLSPAKGMNYYRLVQTDLAGKTTYSKAVQLQFNGGYEITMYPNPISSVINVNGFIAEKADLQIKVTDMNGRVMDVTSLKNQSGNWNARLNASNLKRGLYYVTVTKGLTVIHTETVQKN